MYLITLFKSNLKIIYIYIYVKNYVKRKWNMKWFLFFQIKNQYLFSKTNVNKKKYVYIFL